MADHGQPITVFADDNVRIAIWLLGTSTTIDDDDAEGAAATPRANVAPAPAAIAAVLAAADAATVVAPPNNSKKKRRRRRRNKKKKRPRKNKAGSSPEQQELLPSLADDADDDADVHDYIGRCQREGQTLPMIRAHRLWELHQLESASQQAPEPARSFDRAAVRRVEVWLIADRTPEFGWDYSDGYFF
ncbi:uncharacterized protein B0H64DRAFT_471918 [Chaetomium fimeti]|uniref:Uncharacterized protein n=1 Tax=Chaetomium fimeti TaxID=1854472 RepID=A0AAE0HLA8_9PEZI|nr:hypothetical protein B0H64DRAFT_471918 [Chaetomium fimeti]